MLIYFNLLFKFGLGQPALLIKVFCVKEHPHKLSITFTINNLIVMFCRLQARALMFVHFVFFWPKAYQQRSLQKSHQTTTTLKQAMQKFYPPTEFEPAACAFAQVVEQ